MINNKFNELRTTQKGNIGEEIIDKKLFIKGYQLYKPSFDGSHSFDRLIYSKKNKKFYLCDIKTKPSRFAYPDTGIDFRLYREYLNKSREINLDFLLIFVDENSKTIYGNLLSELEKEIEINYKNKIIKYPLIQKEIIYFPLQKMIKIDIISEEESENIWKQSSMKEKYKEKYNIKGRI